jgi:hypothetical protein
VQSSSQERLRSSEGLGRLSSPSLTAEELGLLNTIKNAAGEDGFAKVFDVNDAGVVGTGH